MPSCRLAGQDARTVRALRVAAEEPERLWERWLAVQPDLDGTAREQASPAAVYPRITRNRVL
jgi:hypothetical protein